MKERPILFSAPMVRAILEGAKTQTRRIVKWVPTPRGNFKCVRLTGTNEYVILDDERGLTWTPYSGSGEQPWPVERYRDACPYGGPGDQLWVRETWQAWNQVSVEYDEWDPITREVRMGERWAEWIELRGRPDRIEYRATSKSVGPWTPAIHMPRWASRIDLEVTGVRVERLHDITEEDARAEGVERDTAPCDHTRLSCEDIGCMGPTYRSAFAALWESINGTESWRENPWVWVIEFKRVEAEARAA